MKYLERAHAGGKWFVSICPDIAAKEQLTKLRAVCEGENRLLWNRKRGSLVTKAANSRPSDHWMSLSDVLAFLSWQR